MDAKKKTRMLRAGILGLGVLVMAAGALAVFTSGDNEGPQIRSAFREAPLNPEFVRYMYERIPGRPWGGYTKDGHALGLIPSPHDTSHYVTEDVPVDISGLPASYDLRTKNKLTSVKDQANCGSCWSFAAFGSLESFFKPGAVWDFSEQDLIEKSGFDMDECAGGNVFMSAAYLARWAGPGAETSHPYEYRGVDGIALKKHVQNIIMLPNKANALDNAKIKDAVYRYGAVAVAMCWYDSSYKSSTCSYYYNGSTNSNGHAICVVGWDDNYSKTKFASTPPGNGAFIVKNSWGSGWGKAGYFYVSYYDTFFGKRSGTAYLKGEATNNYRTNYGYDDLGWVTSIGGGTPTCWAANMFKATATGSIKAVGFYSIAASTAYEIYIYTNAASGKPISGTKYAKAKKGTITGMGYYTIPLGFYVPITKGKSFSIVVKLTTKGYNYPIAIEYKLSGYSSKATALSGQSYASTDGTSWTELKGISSAWTNNCIKAFTKY
jgi:C1A family cysteine protease